MKKMNRIAALLAAAILALSLANPAASPAEAIPWRLLRRT